LETRFIQRVGNYIRNIRNAGERFFRHEIIMDDGIIAGIIAVILVKSVIHAVSVRLGNPQNAGM